MKRFTGLFLALLATQLFAQTGPGGVGDATTNVLWLDASKLTLNNNDPVSSWTDVSGNGNNAVQSNSTNQPVYLSSGFNGMPAVSFDGVDDYLDLTNHISSANQSIFAVNQFGVPNGWTFLYMSDGVDVISSHGTQFGYYGNATFLTGGTYAVGDKKIISVLLDQTGGQATLIGNNNSYKTYSYPGGVSKTRSIIGANYNGSYFQFHSGIVPELIVYDVRINDAQTVIVNNYLATKYGLTISSDFYAFESTHTYELAGIGSWNGTHTIARGTSDIEISNPTSLTPGNFMMWAHDNNDYTENYDVPSGFLGSRWNKTWRVDVTGNIGNVDVRVYVGANGFGTDNNKYYLVYDSDDGTFSNSGSGYYGPGTYDAGTNSVLFQGVSLPDGAWFTLANSTTGVETVASGNWNDPLTWNCNCVPDSLFTVKIKNNHNVTVTTYQSVNNITIESGGTLTLSGSNYLSIKQDLDLYGSFVTNQGGLLFSNEANERQYIRNYSGANMDLYNYHQLNTTSVTLTKGNLRILNEYYSLGRFRNSGNGYVVFLASSTSTPYVSSNASWNPFYGKFRLVRYISSRSADWADIASATASGTFGQLDQSLYFSGIGGDDGNATDGSGNIFYSAYAYDAANQQYDTVKTTSRTLNAGEGFEIWLADDETNYNGGLYYVDGIPNYGDISADAYLPANSGEWALLGNPYMSWIEWASVTKSGVPNEVWIYEASAGNYVLHNSGNVALPPMQGFWVQANANNPSVTFTESSRIANNSSTFYRQVRNDNDFVLSLKDNFTGYYHEARLRADMSASKGYDLGKDVTLLKSKVKEAPNVAFSVDDKQLMVNYINAKQEEIVLPLYVKTGNSSNFTFEVENVDLFTHYNYIELIDLENHKAYDLKSGNSVDVYIEKGASTNRFQLRLSKSKPYTTTQDVVYYRPGKLIMDLDFPTDVYNAQVEVYDVQGRMVLSENVDNPEYTLYLPEGLVKGTYIVKVIKSNQQVSINKLIIEN